MNKLTIPAILVATVMVAGIFAFMPVQEASTVHTTILADTPTLKISANTKNQVSAVATTYTWTSTQPMKIIGLIADEAAQTTHTTTVITIIEVNTETIATADATFTTASTVAAASDYFINVKDEYIGSIAGTPTVAAGWQMPIEGVTQFQITVVTTAGGATVSNTYSLVAETGGTITPS